MGEFLAVLSAITFGAANVLVRKGSTTDQGYKGAFLSMVLTFGLSGIVFIIVGVSSGWPLITVEGVLWFVLAGFLTSFVGRIFLYLSIQHIGSVRASTIKQMSPFFTVFISVLVLEEPLTFWLLLGMALIFIGFTIIVLQSYNDSEKEKTKITFKKIVGKITSLGYVYGPISAIAYAFGMVFRKKGLFEIPDPYYGTMLGAGVGMLIFVILACFQERYRLTVKSTFTRFDLWLFLAGFTISVGQILYFVSLNFIELSRLALIVSMESILTLFFSAWIFKTRENITKTVVIAAIISMIGTIIIAYHK